MLAQAPTPPQAPSPAPVERLGDNLLRVGNIRVDTKAREISVPGKVNDVTGLEFLATAKGGVEGIRERARARHGRDHVQPGAAADRARSQELRRADGCISIRIPPKGDPVEIWIEWDADGKRGARAAKSSSTTRTTKQTLAADCWVYTGSTFMEHNNAYLADLEGTLIGFVHTPAPVIEHSAPIIGNYGANQLNTKLNLKPGTPVTMTIRALPRKS